MSGPSRDRPILFSAPMVRALLDGRKTQTRRPMPWQPFAETAIAGTAISSAVKPRFAAGDRLWVKETFSIADAPYRARQAGLLNYRATPWAIPGRWRAAIHMPRWASRLTLLVTAVRVERLAAITRSDAVAEGLLLLPATRRYAVERGGQYAGLAHPDPRRVYRWLWESIHGAGSWDANPWVAAITFVALAANIDALDARDSRAAEARAA